MRRASSIFSPNRQRSRPENGESQTSGRVCFAAFWFLCPFFNLFKVSFSPPFFSVALFPKLYARRTFWIWAPWFDQEEVKPVPAGWTRRLWSRMSRRGEKKPPKLYSFTFNFWGEFLRVHTKIRSLRQMIVGWNLNGEACRTREDACANWFNSGMVEIELLDVIIRCDLWVLFFSPPDEIFTWSWNTSRIIFFQ